MVFLLHLIHTIILYGGYKPLKVHVESGINIYIKTLIRY